jgi:Tol biopolymer transport system component
LLPVRQKTQHLFVPIKSKIPYRIIVSATPKPISTPIPAQIPTGTATQQVTRLTMEGLNLPRLFSPDSTHLLFSVLVSHSYDGVMNADGSQSQDLTQNPDADVTFPAWPPDGKQTTYVSNRDNLAGVNNLYAMDTDGKHVKRLTNGTEIDYSSA